MHEWPCKLISTGSTTALANPPMPVFVLLLFFLSLSCVAQEFRVCTESRGIPPYVYPEGMGVSQYLIVRAAENLNLDLYVAYHPQPRCLAEVAHGQFDALLIATPGPQMEPLVDFPLDAQGLPDTSLAYGHYRIVAFRLKGQQVNWNGQYFHGLNKPLLYQGGVPIVERVVQQLPDVPTSSTRTPLQMLEMMRLERSQLGVIMEPILLENLKQLGTTYQVEILEPALFEGDAYMAMSKQLMQRDPQLGQRVWAELGRLQNSEDWQLISKQVMSNQLPPLDALIKAAQPRPSVP